MDKILFITYLDDLTEDAGDKIYSINILRELERLYEVHIICFGCSGKQNVLYSARKKPALYSLLSPYPYSIYAHRCSHLKKSFEHACSEHDYKHIFIDHFRLLWLTEHSNTRIASKTIYISHNIEYLSRSNGYKIEPHPLKKIALYLDYLKTLYWEKRLLKKSKACSAISEVDSSILSKYVKKVLLLKPGYNGPSQSNKEFEKLEHNVAWVGSFKFFAKRLNLLEFCDEALKTPGGVNFNLTVIGLMDDDFSNTLRSRYYFCNVHPNVDSVYPYLEKARCGLIYEPVGGGFKLKCLDYIFTKTPIFALQGSCEGIALEDGVSFIERATAKELISAISSRINDPGLLKKISESAYSMCEHKFSWNKRVSEFLNEI